MRTTSRGAHAVVGVRDLQHLAAGVGELARDGGVPELVGDTADQQLPPGVGGDPLGDGRVDEERGEPDRVEPPLGGVRRCAGAERLADDEHVVGVLPGVRGSQVTAYPRLGVLVAAGGRVPPELLDGEVVLQEREPGELEQRCGR